MDLQLENKVILVTGGAKGIGEGIVRVLSQEDAIPVIIGRNQADNERLADQLSLEGRRVHAVEAELTEPEACRQAVEA
ncbi:MAG: SDR family NAD(P)-dependent oxidoreductase, partial [Saprospiraceae bacterium]|nr:SDR family NAD(P)-dependent oxidoreductase [Saprospiraceae bacterium]